MGRVQVDGAVRYVSPVTARLFSKIGSEALGLSSGEVLAPIEGVADWRDLQYQAAGQARTLEPSACPTGAAAAAAVLGMTTQRRVEVVRPCPSSPTNTGVTCPQEYLESILSERVSECVSTGGLFH